MRRHDIQRARLEQLGVYAEAIHRHVGNASAAQPIRAGIERKTVQEAHAAQRLRLGDQRLDQALRGRPQLRAKDEVARLDIGGEVDRHGKLPS